MAHTEIAGMSWLVSLRCTFRPSRIFLSSTRYSSYVPSDPVPPLDERKLPEPTKIDQDTIEQLERVSLVDFGNEKGIEIVESAIRFADRISLVDTEGVKPLFSVLEERSLPLREDVVTEGNMRKEVLANAKLTEDGYFVAPPGNIAVEVREYDLKKVKTPSKNDECPENMP